MTNFTVILPKETTVSKIEVVWKYKPAHVQVLFLRADMQWEQFYMDKNYDQNVLNIEFPQTNIYGIRIDMFRFNPSSYIIAGPVYGIKYIKINRGAKGIRLEKCD